MIRYTILIFVITVLCLYSFKDWYKSLCALILLVGVMEHPDWPKSLMGVQGANPWNLLLLFVLMGWFAARKRAPDQAVLPKNIKTLFFLYFTIIIVSVYRMMVDREGLIDWVMYTNQEIPSTLGMVSEHLINSFKWLIPGALIFLGCNSEARLKWGLVAVVGVYLLLALQIIKTMPLNAIAQGDQLEYLARRLLQKNVGFHRVNLSMMMSGAFWAIYSLREIITKRLYLMYLYGTCFVVLYAQALTGGRTGYGTWAVLGGVLSVLKWRRNFIYGPLFIALVILILPAAEDRLMQGFDEQTIDENPRLDGQLTSATGGPDLYTVTSGRIVAWPYVVEKIGESVLFGYGKLAMKREGISLGLLVEFGESFPHPHNMYLEWLLDNGIVGFLPVILLYLILLKYSFSLFMDSSNKLYVITGGVCASLLMALLVAGLGRQTFYPREGALALWCSIGLMLRVYVQRNKLREEEMVDRKNNNEQKATLWPQGLAKKAVL
jgi:O-antigen ligase